MIPPAGTRELRLAVVLYGGVSLAIYMHGTTKELHRLVRASAEPGDAPAEATPSERVYRRLLDRVAERHPAGVRTRVVVDVISGTSAGGINGVYLAKAVAHDRSQDALRDVWIQRGDIGQLLLGPTWLPRWLRTAWRLARLPEVAPLDGDAMSRWLHEALVKMDEGPAAPDDATLMPPHHRLDLFVTTTDLGGYARELVLGDPALVRERGHRHVLGFRRDDGRDDFTAADNGWLAFAGRVTSSFPGAFAPVSVPSFRAALGPSAGSFPDPERFFRMYGLSAADPDRAAFVDGGVLDNRPFGHAIRAIRSRPADCEVDRRLVYLEPHPQEPGERGATGLPTPLATVLSSVVGIPRQEPILDDILEVTRHNERVARIQDIVALAFPAVAARIEARVDGDLVRLAAAPAAEVLEAWRDPLNEEAREAVGIAHATYLRSKVSSVVDRYARTICALSDYPDDCNQAAFVRAALRAWARAGLLGERAATEAGHHAQIAFLRRFDLDYGIRRMRFVIDALSWWLPQAGSDGIPSREALGRGKALLYEAQAELVDAAAGTSLATDLTARVRACFSEAVVDEWVGRPEDYVTASRAELEDLQEAFGQALDARLAGVGERMYGRVQEVMDGWSDRVRRDLLIRYLGFPLWDAILHPVQSVAEAGERDTIEIVRFSPEDVGQLALHHTPLSGNGKAHFGAFFTAAGRECDYLRGRLDGAERLIGLLLPGGTGDAELAPWCREAFAAIVEEEREHLPRAEWLFAAVAQYTSVP